MEAMALTDHGVMYGAIEFYMKAKKAGIKPIIGCLPPGHLIYTKEGMKPVEEIQIGDFVLTHKGRFRKVVNTMVREHKGKLYGVRAANSNTVWVTEEHPILTTDHTTKELKWIRADQVEHGRRIKKKGVKTWKQYAVFPKLKENIKEELYPLEYLDESIYGQVDDTIRKIKKYNKFDSLQPLYLPAKLSVNNQLAKFFGLFLAEGSFQHDPMGRPAALSLAFEDRETDLMEVVSDALAQISPNPSLIYHRPERHLAEINHSNTLVARWIANLTKKGAANKRIPPPAFLWSLERLKYLLEGIIDGDGRKNPISKQITVRIKSGDLAWGIKLIAATLGYPGKVTKKLEEGTKTIYTFTYSPDGKYKRILEDKENIYLPIKDVATKYYEGLVYNFTVDEDNSYISDFALHNCEVYISENSMHDKRPNIDNKRYHLILLAKNNTGYKNLIKIVSAAHLEGYYYKPRIDKDFLRKHSEGLIALSACLGGELSRTIQFKNYEKAKNIALEHEEIFGKGNYYIELQQHPHIQDQNLVTPQLVKLAKETGIPTVATQDSHYIHTDDAHAHDVLLAVQTGNKLDDADRLTMREDDFSLIDGEKMYEKLKTINEEDALTAIENTNKIAEECNVDLTLGKFIFPNFALEPDKTADQMLDELTMKGAKGYGLDNHLEAEKRRLYELEVIKNKNYAPYFLVVADILRFAHEHNIYTAVRGSVAGSLVAYLSGITNVNPLDFQLPFERFLNPFRPSAPDIDMDFADDRREEVVEYVKKKYGADKVAQIVTFGTMMARGAVRDVARALGKPYDVGDRIAKLIPMGSQGFPMTIDHAIELDQQLKDLYRQDSEARQILDIAKKLEGTVRHASVHAAGVVIAPQPLTEYTPIQFDPKENSKLITQYDMYTVGEDGVGLTKLDFLGIRNLAILENAVHLVHEHRNIDINIEQIPFDDKRTFAMLAKGETEGIFQLNGSGMTKHLMELKPSTIHDINAMVALYRPGPINNIPEYIARKHGRSQIKYFHPKTEKFLDKSYGILVYQDDLLFTAMELAGYNWESVDKFRKAVGKKIPKEMAKQHEIFVQGCQTHSGMSKEKAEQIWNLFEPFQGYGFNKAHAACYGRVAYQTAYMKANFPSEYMCAVLTAEAGDTEKIAEVITECQRMGIPVLPPDINSSFKNFTVIKNTGTKDQIRFGLLTIKNLGENIAEAIIAERDKNGRFKDIDDFASRVNHKDLNKKSLESLIKCGAIDSFEERNTLLNNLEALLSHSRDKQKQSATGQISLFGESVETKLPPLRLTPTEPAKSWEKLMWEKELLGLYVSDHPLNSYQTQFRLENVTLIKNISLKTVGSIKIGGIITKIQKIITKTGRPMLFSNVEDLTSKIELVVFPNVLEKNPEVWKENNIVVARGKINDRDGALKMLCDEVKTVALPA